MRSPFVKTLTQNTAAYFLLAGVIYSSWPLAYLLNRQDVNRLASDLEALHQPFNWVFITLDIASGCLVVIGCLGLLITVKRVLPPKKERGLEIAIIGTALFGLLTALDALLPLDCLEGTPNCRPPLHNPYFVIHGIISIGSIAGLSISIFAVWLVIFFQGRGLKNYAHLTPGSFLITWIAFGVFTLYLILNNRSSALSQHIFIGFCSLWLIVLPNFIRYILSKETTSSKGFRTSESD